jgi:hypothetical protein
MNYLYEALEKPARLYIKQCPHCGLKYFGKHTGQNIEGYPGSGTFWTKHLNEHNVEPIHLWNSDWYYDTSIKRFALKFSSINKIVESNEWANLIPEDGLRGGWDLINMTGRNLYGYNGRTPNVPDDLRRGLETFRKNLKNPEWREKHSKKISIGIRKWQSENGNPFLGKTHSDETKEKISDANKGKIPWNKGLEHTDETKEKIKTTLKSKVIPNLKKSVSFCKGCIKEEKRLNAYYWYNEYMKSSSSSLREFVRKSNYDKSHVSLVKMFKTYIPEFKTIQGKSHNI